MLGIFAKTLMTATRQKTGSEARRLYAEDRQWLQNSRAARARGMGRD